MTESTNTTETPTSTDELVTVHKPLARALISLGDGSRQYYYVTEDNVLLQDSPFTKTDVFIIVFNGDGENVYLNPAQIVSVSDVRASDKPLVISITRGEAEAQGLTPVE